MDLPWIIKNRILMPYSYEKRHEISIQKILIRLTGATFWDIGANVGMYSLLLRKNFRRIFAVEPDPVARAKLKRRILLHLANNVTVLPYALSNHVGESLLTIGKDRFHAWSKLGEAGTRVETATIDSICTGLVDLMKIDVEGAEFLVLEGARRTLEEGRIATLLIELHSWDRESELHDILTTYQYKCEWFRSSSLHVFAQKTTEINPEALTSRESSS